MLLGPGDGTASIHEAACPEVARARRLKWPVVDPIPGHFRARLRRGDCPGCRDVWDRSKVG